MPRPAKRQRGAGTDSGDGGGPGGPGGVGFLPFGEALVLVRSLRLGSIKEWREWRGATTGVVAVPSSPDQVYKDAGWRGWGHWLCRSLLADDDSTGPQRQQQDKDRKKRRKQQGTGAPAVAGMLPFAEALVIARALRLTSLGEWWAWSNTEARPSSIPCNPHVAYTESGWQGYGHWLGTVGAQNTSSPGRETAARTASAAGATSAPAPAQKRMGRGKGPSTARGPALEGQGDAPAPKAAPSPMTARTPPSRSGTKPAPKPAPTSEAADAALETDAVQEAVGASGAGGTGHGAAVDAAATEDGNQPAKGEGHDTRVGAPDGTLGEARKGKGGGGKEPGTASIIDVFSSESDSEGTMSFAEHSSPAQQDQPLIDESSSDDANVADITDDIGNADNADSTGNADNTNKAGSADTNGGGDANGNAAPTLAPTTGTGDKANGVSAAATLSPSIGKRGASSAVLAKLPLSTEGKVVGGAGGRGCGVPDGEDRATGAAEAKAEAAVVQQHCVPVHLRRVHRRVGAQAEGEGAGAGAGAADGRAASRVDRK